jgi:hypothetical protein
MLKNKWLVLAGSTFIFLAGLSAGSLLQSGIARAQASKHVYEVRTYTAPDGKLGELHSRFRDHTLRIFNKHGMKSVIYLAPQDAPDSANTLTCSSIRAAKRRRRRGPISRRTPNGSRCPPTPRSTGASSARSSRCSRTRPTTRR